MNYIQLTNYNIHSYNYTVFSVSINLIFFPINFLGLLVFCFLFILQLGQWKQICHCASGLYARANLLRFGSLCAHAPRQNGVCQKAYQLFQLQTMPIGTE